MSAVTDQFKSRAFDMLHMKHATMTVPHRLANNAIERAAHRAR